jgi:TP901 family phage tail tape measure protein
MLQLDLATAWVKVAVDLKGLDAGLGNVQGRLRRLPPTYAVRLTADARGLEAAATRAEARLSRLRSAAGRAVGGRGAAQFGLGMLQGAGLGLALSPQMAAGELAVRGASAAISTAIDLQSQFATLGRVANLSAEGVARLKAEVFAIGQGVPGVGISDIMGIAEAGAKAGVGDRGGVGALSTFTRGLARVRSVIPTADIATDDLAEKSLRALNVFRLGPEYVEGFGSALARMADTSTASAADILEVTTRLSGFASAVGVTLPQTMALAKVMKDVGLPNEAGASAMTRVLGMMTTDKAKLAGVAGVSEDEFAATMRRNPIEALGLVMGKFAGVKDTVGKGEFLKEELGLSNVRDIALFGQMAAKFGEVAPAAAEGSKEFSSLDALNKAEATQGGTTASSLTRLQNAATELADALGGPLLGPIADLAEALSMVVGLVSKPLGSGTGQSVLSRATDPIGTRGLAMGLLKGINEGDATKYLPELSTDTPFGKVNFGLTSIQRGLGLPTAADVNPPEKPKKGPAVPDINPNPTAEEWTPEKGLRDLQKDPQFQAVMSAGRDKLQTLLGLKGLAQQAASQLLGQGLGIAGQLLTPDTGHRFAATHTTGMDFGRRLQEDVLNQDKAREEKKVQEDIRENTKAMATTMKDFLGKAMPAVGAVFSR